ncbi:MAG: hypothetical protein ACFFAN_14010 [Promethearchaeota archaeon]
MNNKLIEFIQEDLKLYNELKSLAFSAFKKGNYESTLKYIYYAASYAWVVHFGLWCDDDLENLLVKIGKYMKKKLISQAKKNNGKKDYKVAYLASILRDVGGHNILLKHWINILSERYKDQDLYISKSDGNPLYYPNLKKSLIKKGVKIFELKSNLSFLERIKNLINLIEFNSPDVLILFTHANDVTIIPALTALTKKPYTIFFNHADHTFWLGKIISDCIIEQRIEGAKFSKKYRRVEVNQYIIPLTSKIKPIKVSKKKFGIPENSTLSISVGGIMKVESPSEHNYYKTIELVLKNFPNHYHMFVTNYPPKTIPKELVNTSEKIIKRFIINGPFPNLEPIYGMGDFLIDTFPIGGGMVIADAMACALPIVAFRSKKFSIVSDGGGELPINYPFLTYNYNDFVDRIFQLIQDPQLRKDLGENLYNHFQQNLSPKIVNKLLFDIIDGNVKSKDIFNYKTVDLANFNYDVESGQRAFLTERKNFILIDLRHKAFTFKQRLRFFKDAQKRHEFTSIKETFAYVIMILFRNYVSILFKPFYYLQIKKKLLNALN